MDIGVQLVQLEKRLAAVERQSRLSSASLDNASLVVKDGGGSLRGILGQQPDGTTAVTIVNGGPPPAPSTPTVASALGGIAAGWDGTFADGAVIPMDWSRVEVHAAVTDDFAPTADTLQATIETAQGGIAYIPATAPMYVRLLARNTSGTASTPTDTVGPYAPRPVAGEIGIGEITATLISDGAVTTPKLFANAVTTAKLDVGSVDATALKADAVTGKVITGGTITGTTITGGRFQTSATGRRVVITPSGAESVPTVELWSGLSDEVYPAELSAGTRAVSGTSRPYAFLSTSSFGAGASSLELTAPTDTAGGTAEIYVENGPSVGVDSGTNTATISVPVSGGSTTYYTFDKDQLMVPNQLQLGENVYRDVGNGIERQVTPTTWTQVVYRTLNTVQVSNPPFTTTGAYVAFTTAAWPRIAFVVPPSGIAEVTISGDIANSATATSTSWLTWGMAGTGYTRSPGAFQGLRIAGSIPMYGSKTVIIDDLPAGVTITVTPYWNISSGSSSTATAENGQLIVRPIG